jgi:hypothetical protein
MGPFYIRLQRCPQTLEVNDQQCSIISLYVDHGGIYTEKRPRDSGNLYLLGQLLLGIRAVLSYNLWAFLRSMILPE